MMYSHTNAMFLGLENKLPRLSLPKPALCKKERLPTLSLSGMLCAAGVSWYCEGGFTVSRGSFSLLNRVSTFLFMATGFYIEKIE
jgi:hypothetical protein